MQYAFLEDMKVGKLDGMPTKIKWKLQLRVLCAFYFNLWSYFYPAILASYTTTTSFLSHIVVVLHLRLMYMHQISFFITF